MASIAFIGPDGTGKTTITRRLEQSGLLPFKYLYMGVNIYAATTALPTTRLAEFLKRRLRRHADTSGDTATVPSGGRRETNWLWATARLGNHLAEEWFRQLVSWSYQLRGFVVLYDRHFMFDFSPEIVAGLPAEPDRRLHHWLVTHAYPRPQLVFFLDAPGEVLYARKGESTVEELDRRRRGFEALGARMPNVIRVDATRPLDDVYRDVVVHLTRFYDGRRRFVSHPRTTTVRTTVPVSGAAELE
jgi:thymidylate kinase